MFRSPTASDVPTSIGQEIREELVDQKHQDPEVLKARLRQWLREDSRAQQVLRRLLGNTEPSRGRCTASRVLRYTGRAQASSHCAADVPPDGVPRFRPGAPEVWAELENFGVVAKCEANRELLKTVVPLAQYVLGLELQMLGQLRSGLEGAQGAPH